MDGWATQGQATVLGGDFNINLLSCSSAAYLDQQYYNIYGPSTCIKTGYGPSYEADEVTTYGETPFNENTLGLLKYDYMFINRQRFYNNFGADATYSTVSDHDPLRTSVTVHD